MMTKCVFCPELGVATTATTTTSNEAFPFLCIQLGLSPSSTTGSLVGGRNGGGAPCALCSSCHSLWEEVSVLYTNMQGLVNLMGRRVAQFKKNIDKGHGHGEGGPVGEGSSTRGSRKRVHHTQSPPDDESMLSWWYPSASDTATESKKKKNQVDENPVGDVNIDGSDVDVDHVEADVDHADEIKFEVEDVILVDGDGAVDAAQEGMGLDLEEFEISPDPGGDEDDENSRDDPSYDPLDDSATTPKNAPLKKWSKTTHHWIQKSKYENLEAAKAYIKKTGKYVYYYKKNERTYYNCRARRSCPSKIYLEDTAEGVNLVGTKADHSHDEGVGRGISKSVKTMIKDLLLSGIDTPQLIQSNLKLPPEHLPEKLQIGNFLRYWKSKESSNHQS